MLKRIILLFTVAAFMAAMLAASAAPGFADDFCEVGEPCEEDPGNGVVPPVDRANGAQDDEIHELLRDWLEDILEDDCRANPSDRSEHNACYELVDLFPMG